MAKRPKRKPAEDPPERKPNPTAILDLDVLGENAGNPTTGLAMHQAMVKSLTNLGVSVSGEGAMDLGNGMVGFTAVKLAATLDHLSGLLARFKEPGDVEHAVDIARAIASLSNSMARSVAEFRQNNDVGRKKVVTGNVRSYTPGQVVTVESKPEKPT